VDKVDKQPPLLQPIHWRIHFMEEKGLMVVKSNKLIEASYKLSLQEQRLLLSCIAQIDSHKDISKQDEFRITAKDFSTLANIPIKNAYRDLKEAAECLFERRLTFKSPSSDKFLVSRWVSSVEYNEKEGSVELCFAQRILPLISQIRGHFTRYKIENIANLTSIHSIRIYELCLQYLTIGSRKISIEELKNCLGIENQYPEFKDLNKRVLKPSVDQINKHTDIKIKLTAIRKLRKIESLKFEIESKKPKHHKLSNQKINKELTSISKYLDQTLH